MNENQKTFLKSLRYYNEKLEALLESNHNEAYCVLNYKDAEQFEWLAQNNTNKTYKLLKSNTGKDRTTEIIGDMAYIQQYFGYTLDNAISSGVKINMTPKTIKSLVSNIQKALEHKESSCYQRTFIEIAK